MTKPKVASSPSQQRTEAGRGLELPPLPRTSRSHACTLGVAEVMAARFKAWGSREGLRVEGLAADHSSGTTLLSCGGCRHYLEKGGFSLPPPPPPPPRTSQLQATAPGVA